MKTTARRKLRKKEQIQLSAIKIVNKYGFEQATMEQIAAELDMTKGALYYYFKNKEDLLFQCHYFVLSNALEELQAIADSDLDAEQQILALTAAHVKYVIEERDFFNLMIEPNKAFTDKHLQPVLNLRKRYAAIFDEVIEKGIQNGIFRVENSFIARMAMLGAMNWIQQWYREEGSLQREQIELHFKHVILKILK